MPSSPPPQQHVFAGIRFAISASFPPERAQELRHLLETNGAQYAANGVEDAKLTTVISNSNRFEGFETVASREGIDVVTEKWVEKSMIIGKMQLPQYYSADPAMVFSGVVACACELPAGDLEVLSAGITALGGQWRVGLTKEVTHLFALTPGSAKYATAFHYQGDTGIRVVLPHWFDDAVRLGMGGLSTAPYEWPEPEILKSVESLVAGTADGKGKGLVADLEKDDVKRNMYRTAAHYTLSRGQSSPSADTSLALDLQPTSDFLPGSSKGVSGVGQVWNQRKVLLSRTLGLYQGRREAMQIGIERAGGIVLRFRGDHEDEEEVSEEEKRDGKEMGARERIRRHREAEVVDECDILVTRWRHGRAYVKAVKASKTVGTLAWVFHVQSTGIFTRPLDQLLHYPVPPKTIEHFSNHVVTVTNYTGEAREYLKKLITTMGATFTPSMSGKNTVLVAAYVSGTKAEKAQSWSIPVVNHTWLEDCFVQWRNLTVALEKYIVFPPGVDFSALLGERGVGIGHTIEAEAEDMAEGGFEEDLVGMDDPDGDVEMQAPNGTDASMKEVASGLVDDDEDGVRQKSPSKSKSKSKAKAPAGMDVDFAPPSTAMVATDMNWGIDFGGDDDRQPSPSPPPVDHTTPRKSPSKRNGASSPTKSPMKPTYTPKRKVTANETEHETAEEAEPEVVKSKAKGKKVKAVELDEDDLVEEEVPKRKLTRRAKPKQVEEVIELDDSDEEEEAPPKSKHSKSKTTKSAKAQSISSDEELEEPEVDNIRSKPSAKAKPSPSAKPKATPTSTSKPKSKVKAKAPTPQSDEEDDEVPASKSKPSAPPAKSKKRRLPISSDEEQGSDTEAEQLPKTTPKAKTKLVRRVTVELEKTSGGGRQRSKPEKKAAENDNEDETDVHIVSTKKSKVTTTQAAATVTPTKSPAAAAGTSSSAGGLLKKTKGDARTRIKKKVPKEDVESEAEESEVEVLVKGKGAKGGDAAKSGRKNRKEESDEEQEQESDVEEERPTRSKAKAQAALKSKAKAKPTSTTKPTTPTRSKPLRVYSTEEEDDETNTNVPDMDLDDDDDSLPAAPLMPTKAEAKAKAKASGKVKAQEEVVASKPKPKRGKAKTASAPSDDEAEEDDDGVEFIKPSKSRKAASKSKATTSTITPKRNLSVIMPSLAISGGSKGKAKRKEQSDEDEEEEEVVVTKSKKAAASGTANKVVPKAKAKTKISTPESEDDDDDDEVSVAVSPRTRALGKTDSFKVIAGQASTSAVKTRDTTKLKPKSKAKVSSTTISASRKPSKSKPIEPMEMEVDDDEPSSAPPGTSARPSTTPTSTVSAAPPRRNAAAKATQRLRETIMPDVVNFEAQMKKSRGKGRQSGSSMGAFAVDGESERDQKEKAKRKKNVDDDNDEVAGDGDVKRKKKRRVSDENDNEAVRVGSKAKGKQKVVDDDGDVEMEEVISTKPTATSKIKTKVEEDAESGITMMTTQVTLGDDVVKILTKLGVKVTTRASECTHLIARQVVRTEKFLCALANAPFILTDKWATASASARKLLPEREFLLKDTSGENKYDVDLALSLRRAKSHKGKLLEGHTFYVTTRVAVDAKLLKNVVNACGGQLTTQSPSVRIINAGPDTRHVISCKEDIAIWRPIAGNGYKVYSHELLLTGALKQEMEWDREDFILKS